MNTTPSPIDLPVPVAALFAARHHRLHHALWHGLRDFWKHSSTSEDTRAAITSLGWMPPRPALRWYAGGWMPDTLNGSGVDFLYMHREMIAEFDQEMKNAGADSNVGWEVIPEPGRSAETHPGIEVPPTWNLPDELKWLERRFQMVKSDEFFWSRMRWWDREFHDRAYLRTLTLGQLGSLLETSVHNDMHMRWASVPKDPKTGEELALGRPETSIDQKWDDPVYDFLGETYSSHVHPIFWRIHKWVDSIIDEWFDAHDELHPGEISKIIIDNKILKIRWFESEKWIETHEPWSSPNPHGHHDSQKMEEVYKLLFPETGLAVSGSGIAPRVWF